MQSANPQGRALLSYQHEFHAGNHGDVIKHITLVAILRKLVQKPKPFFYLDTHAGAGVYDVDTANKHDRVLAHDLLSKDFSGIELVDIYLNIVERYKNKGLYPGSPSFLYEYYRDIDNVNLNELHPTTHRHLVHHFFGSGMTIHHDNAFTLINALTPPKPNRGLILIDPPYEDKFEYDEVVESITKCLKKWPQAIIAIWYPLLSPTRKDRNSGQVVKTTKSGLSENMLKRLSEIAKDGLLNIEYKHELASDDIGMFGSGMAVVNPPWQLNDNVDQALAWLLAQNKGSADACYNVEYLVTPK